MMKKVLLIIFITVFLTAYGCRSPKPPVVETKSVKNTESMVAENYSAYSDPSTWLIGYINKSRLTKPPHSEWYNKEKDKYTFDDGAVMNLKGLINSEVSVKIVMGTWCPDSRREVPRFIKILETIGFPEDKLQLIGVDNMKISPVENYDALIIVRVPTFIIYRNNIEAGRIIENPETSLEQDMKDILTRNE